MPESSPTIGEALAPAPRWKHGPIPVIGLTGGIGGGKSAATALMAAWGVVVVDADSVGHGVLRRPEIAGRVRRRFGDGVVAADGSIDRRALGRIVFADAEALRELESIVHPPMLEEFGRAIDRAEVEATAPAVVLDAAILLESGWDAECDVVAFVDAPREVRLDRVRRTRGWTEEQLAAREAAQWPLDRKRERADVVLSNAGDLADLEGSVGRLFEMFGREPSPAPTAGEAAP